MAANREQDRRLLDLVRFRASGASLSEVAKRFGMSTAAATFQTNKVMDEDLTQNPGERDEIMASYWPRKER